jgi:hypothetical protein
LGNYESSINKISEKLDELNALDQSGIKPALVRQRVEKRALASDELIHLKEEFSKVKNYLCDLKLKQGLVNFSASLAKITEAGDANDSEQAEFWLQVLAKQYDEAVRLLSSNQETSLERSPIQILEEEFQATARSTLTKVLNVLVDYHKDHLVAITSLVGSDRTKFSDAVAVCDAAAKYLDHLALINESDSQATVRDHIKHFAISCQMEGLHAKAYKAAERMDEPEIRNRLEGMAASFGEAETRLQACFGVYATPPGDSITSSNLVKTSPDFPAPDKQVILETFADAYADLSIQYRQFQEGVTNPIAKEVLSEMIKEAQALEICLHGVIARLGSVAEVTPASRMEILRKYELSAIAISRESESIAEQFEASSSHGPRPKATGKKNRKPQIVALPEPSAEDEPIAQTSEAAETSPPLESASNRQDETLPPEVRDLRRRIKSLRESVKEKFNELTQAKEKVDELITSPLKRRHYSPDLLALRAQQAAMAASAAAALCGQLAASYARLVELRGAAQADFHTHAAKNYADRESNYNSAAADYKKLAETWRLERIKECLAEGPTDNLFRSLPDREIARVDTVRLKYPVIATDSGGALLVGDGGKPLYDLVVEDKITLKDGKQFVIHRHFHSSDPDSTKEQLLEGAGRLIAHTLKTIKDAPLGRAYREPKEHLILRGLEAKQKSAEAVQERLKGLEALLKPQRARSSRR